MKCTFQLGKAGQQMNRDHNARSSTWENWEQKLKHPELSTYNQIVIDENPREYLLKRLEEPVRQFNERNISKHPERVKSLTEEVNKGMEKYRELVVQIGKENDHLNIQNSTDFLKEYVDHFQRNNPAFHVFGAYIHFDETTPHLHLDFLPICECSKGLPVKVSMENALKAQGFKDTGKYAETALKQWLSESREDLEKFAVQYSEREGKTIEPSEPSSKTNCKRHEDQWRHKCRMAKQECTELEQTKIELNQECEALDKECEDTQTKLFKLLDKGNTVCSILEENKALKAKINDLENALSEYQKSEYNDLSEDR